MKLILFIVLVGIGMFFTLSMISKNNENPTSDTSGSVEVIENKINKKERLKIYYIRHAEAGHNVKKEWGIYPESEWPAYVGDKNMFTPKGIMQQSRVSNKLKRFHFDYVAVSPIWRCKNTVLPYLVDSKLKAEVWPELAEIYATSLIVSPDLPKHTSKQKI